MCSRAPAPTPDARPERRWYERVSHCSASRCQPQAANVHTRVSHWAPRHLRQRRLISSAGQPLGRANWLFQERCRSFQVSRRRRLHFPPHSALALPPKLYARTTSVPPPATTTTAMAVAPSTSFASCVSSFPADGSSSALTATYFAPRRGTIPAWPSCGDSRARNTPRPSAAATSRCRLSSTAASSRSRA